MSRDDAVLFTGERLHAGSALFGVDLARHRAAYQFALELGAEAPRVLDLGCGSGYGTAELARALKFVGGVDRVRPDPAARVPGARYLLADLHGLPLAAAAFSIAATPRWRLGPQVIPAGIEGASALAPVIIALAEVIVAEGLDPVVEIVNGDEQDVRSRLFALGEH